MNPTTKKIRIGLFAKQSTVIRYAPIYDIDQQLFAGYKRPGQSVDMPLDEFTDTAFFKGQNIYMSRPIEMNGEFLGVIVMSADTQSLNIQTKVYINLGYCPRNQPYIGLFTQLAPAETNRYFHSNMLDDSVQRLSSEIQSILTATVLSPEYLELELTENSFLGSKLSTAPVLKGLLYISAQPHSNLTLKYLNLSI